VGLLFWVDIKRLYELGDCDEQLMNQGLENRKPWDALMASWVAAQASGYEGA
jgi:hypothetical protein